jgi:thymidylate synthase (FAD)
MASSSDAASPEGDDSAQRAPELSRRPTVSALDERLGVTIPILDHGFVRAIDYFGDDGAIVQAARVSYGKGTRKLSEDRQLVRYLMRHRHTTPFEMCEIKLHVKMPIFVARQWIRHRTASVNEISGRYSIFTDEYYLPTPANLAKQSKDNKQGRGEVLTGDTSEHVLKMLREGSESAYADYEELIGEHELARELARMTLPVNYYTQWYWKIDLHNLLHFLALRLHPHAQYEIRVYAEAIADLVKAWCPVAYEAFEDYRLHSFEMSGTMMGAVRRMLAGEAVDQKSSGLSKREWEELMTALGKA